MFCSLLIFFFKISLFAVFFLKNLSGISVECQAVWIEIMSIGPDLGPNCLQRLSADDTSKSRVYDDNSSKLDCWREIANQGYTLNLKSIKYLPAS